MWITYMDDGVITGMYKSKPDNPNCIEVENKPNVKLDRVIDGELVSTEVVAAVFVEKYQTKRRREYPSIEDQLDALWKYIKDIPELPRETQQMIAKIQRAKAKYPKV